MRKISFPLALVLLMSLIITASCTPATPPTAAPTQPPAATETSLPPTLPAATNTPAASPMTGTPITIDQIHMFNANAGWGWASQDGEMNQLLRTSDGGLSWQDVSPQGKHSFSSSYFLDPQNAWLITFNPDGTTGQMLRTADSGTTWQELPKNDLMQSATLTFSSPADGLAEIADMGAGSAYIKYYQTKDGGSSWEFIPLQTPASDNAPADGSLHLCNICGDNFYFDGARAIITHGDMAGDPQGKVRLSISTDLGKTWQDLQLPMPEQYAKGSVAPLTAAFFGADGILPINLIKYADDGALEFSVVQLYSSPDGGLTWLAAPGTMDVQGNVVSAVDILSTKDAYVRCGTNLCATHDSGATWTNLPATLNFDFNAQSADYVSQTTFVDPQNGYAITGDPGASTLYHTPDGGATWQKITPKLITGK